MPITTKQFGKHENVLWVEFGTGDIEFTKAREEDEKHESLMFFKQHEIPHAIGEESYEFVGKTTDEVDGIKLVLKFKKPESITALIHSLTELQKEVFLSNRGQGVQECDANTLNQGTEPMAQKEDQELEKLAKEAIPQHPYPEMTYPANAVTVISRKSWIAGYNAATGTK